MDGTQSSGSNNPNDFYYNLRPTDTTPRKEEIVVIQSGNQNDQAKVYATPEGSQYGSEQTKDISQTPRGQIIKETIAGLKENEQVKQFDFIKGQATIIQNQPQENIKFGFAPGFEDEKNQQSVMLKPSFVATYDPFLGVYTSQEGYKYSVEQKYFGYQEHKDQAKEPKSNIVTKEILSNPNKTTLSNESKQYLENQKTPFEKYLPATKWFQENTINKIEENSPNAPWVAKEIAYFGLGTVGGLITLSEIGKYTFTKDPFWLLKSTPKEVGSAYVETIEGIKSHPLAFGLGIALPSALRVKSFGPKEITLLEYSSKWPEVYTIRNFETISKSITGSIKNFASSSFETSKLKVIETYRSIAPSKQIYSIGQYVNKETITPIKQIFDSETQIERVARIKDIEQKTPELIEIKKSWFGFNKEVTQLQEPSNINARLGAFAMKDNYLGTINKKVLLDVRKETPNEFNKVYKIKNEYFEFDKAKINNRFGGDDKTSPVKSPGNENKIVWPKEPKVFTVKDILKEPDIEPNVKTVKTSDGLQMLIKEPRIKIKEIVEPPKQIFREPNVKINNDLFPSMTEQAKALNNRFGAFPVFSLLGGKIKLDNEQSISQRFNLGFKQSNEQIKKQDTTQKIEQGFKQSFKFEYPFPQPQAFAQDFKKDFKQRQEYKFNFKTPSQEQLRIELPFQKKNKKENVIFKQGKNTNAKLKSRLRITSDLFNIERSFAKYGRANFLAGPKAEKSFNQMLATGGIFGSFPTFEQVKYKGAKI